MNEITLNELLSNGFHIEFKNESEFNECKKLIEEYGLHGTHTCIGTYMLDVMSFYELVYNKDEFHSFAIYKELGLANDSIHRLKNFPNQYNSDNIHCGITVYKEFNKGDRYTNVISIKKFKILLNKWKKLQQ